MPSDEHILVIHPPLERYWEYLVNAAPRTRHHDEDEAIALYVDSFKEASYRVDSSKGRNIRIMIIICDEEKLDEYDLTNGVLLLKQLTSAFIVVSCYGSSEFADTCYIAGHESGADVVLKNPTPHELYLQVQSIRSRIEILPEINYRNTYYANDSSIFAGELIVLCDERQAYVNDVEIELTRKSFDILVLLARNPRHVLRYSEIYRYAWGEQFDFGSSEVVWNHISRLRIAISKAGGKGDYIKTHTGIGYSFVIPSLQNTKKH